MSKVVALARALRPAVVQAAKFPLRTVNSSAGRIFRSFGAAAGHGHDDHHDNHHGHDSHHDMDTFLDPGMVCERIITVIGNFEQVTVTVTPTSRIKEDLNLDSLDAVEVVMALEDEFVFEIPDSEAEKFFAVPDIVDYISKHPMAK